MAMTQFRVATKCYLGRQAYLLGCSLDVNDFFTKTYFIFLAHRFSVFLVVSYFYILCFYNNKFCFYCIFSSVISMR